MIQTNQRVCVLGLGYVGLPTASLLGTMGYQVHGVDISPTVIDRIKDGEAPYSEPGLDTLVLSALNSDNLELHTTPAEADVFIVAVPTPLGRDNTPDLSNVEAAARSIVPYLRAGNLVILESTSPVGTTRGMLSELLAQSGLSVGEELLVAHCPERVLPGNVIKELMTVDRIVGGVSEASTEAAIQFFRGFLQGEIHAASAEVAELTKLVENSYRDVNIAFANELSVICEKEGVRVQDVIALANRHPRVNILQPGPGVGGHCIAIDPWFIVSRAPELAKIIALARDVNDGKSDWVVDRVSEAASGYSAPVIACLGLSYKADIEDLRESPAVRIVRQLVDKKVGTILVCEPHLEKHDTFDLADATPAIDDADIVVMLVGHRQFRSIDRRQLANKVLIDTVGFFDD